MVGNVIQSLYLQQRDYPEAAALSFLMMLAILVVVASTCASPALAPSWARRTRQPHERCAGHGCAATRC